MTIFPVVRFQSAVFDEDDAGYCIRVDRSVKVGPNSGQVQVKIVSVPGAGSYELRWAPVSAGGVPSQWTTQPITNDRSATVVTGLTPGTTTITIN